MNDYKSRDGFPRPIAVTARETLVFHATTFEDDQTMIDELRDAEGYFRDDVLGALDTMLRDHLEFHATEGIVIEGQDYEFGGPGSVVSDAPERLGRAVLQVVEQWLLTIAHNARGNTGN